MFVLAFSVEDLDLRLERSKVCWKVLEVEASVLGADFCGV